MDKMILDIWVGVIAGVLTTALLYVAKVVFDSKLSPWLAELRYTGIKIDGAWSGVGKDEHEQSETSVTLFLQQSATQVEGLYTVKYTSPTNRFELVFKARGYIWEGYLMLTFLPMDRRVTSCANGLFKLAGGGVRLDGQACFRNVNSESVDAHGISMTRDRPVC